MNDKLTELMVYTKRMRMRGFRCCLVCMLIASSLNVVPLSVLKAQALFESQNLAHLIYFRLNYQC